MRASYGIASEVLWPLSARITLISLATALEWTAIYVLIRAALGA
jgi:hypothetical protein